MNDKYLQYYPWPLLEADNLVFRSMLLDDNVFASLPKLYTQSHSVKTVDELSLPKYVDQICTEELKGDAIMPFVLLLNGESSSFSRPLYLLVPEYDALWKVLLQVPTEPKAISLVSPQPKLSEELDAGINVVGSSYTRIDWLFSVIDSIYGGEQQ